MLNNLAPKEGHLKLSGDRIFYSIQGEGVSMGEPAVFLRLHFCNLACQWCDTPYAWQLKDKYINEAIDFSFEDVARMIKGAWRCKNGSKTKRLVITGGEPLIQKQKIDILLDLLDDWSIEIETNGTIIPTSKQLKRCQINCSPKLKNSGNEKIRRYKPNVIRELKKWNAYFKFVVSQPEDLDEIDMDFIRKLDIPISKVILMPLGINSEDLKKHSNAVAEYAKEKGYRMLGRLHIDIFGNTRGT